MSNETIKYIKEFKMNVLKTKINYGDLGKKQKEMYNFQKVSAVFADYGYSVTPLRDDAEFADFVAVPFLRDENTKPLWVQLKGGLTFWNKYLNKDLYICFFDRKSKTWYLYPHDELYNKMENELRERTKDWDNEHKYNTAPSSPDAPSYPAWAKDFLEIYKIDQ